MLSRVFSHFLVFTILALSTTVHSKPTFVNRRAMEAAASDAPVGRVLKQYDMRNDPRRTPTKRADASVPSPMAQVINDGKGDSTGRRPSGTGAQDTNEGQADSIHRPPSKTPTHHSVAPDRDSFSNALAELHSNDGTPNNFDFTIFDSGLEGDDKSGASKSTATKPDAHFTKDRSAHRPVPDHNKSGDQQGKGDQQGQNDKKGNSNQQGQQGHDGQQGHSDQQGPKDQQGQDDQPEHDADSKTSDAAPLDAKPKNVDDLRKHGADDDDPAYSDLFGFLTGDTNPNPLEDMFGRDENKQDHETGHHSEHDDDPSPFSSPFDIMTGEADASEIFTEFTGRDEHKQDHDAGHHSEKDDYPPPRITTSEADATEILEDLTSRDEHKQDHDAAHQPHKAGHPHKADHPHKDSHRHKDDYKRNDRTNRDADCQP
ncbi:hypothetical protein GALMADRAFT_276551 [Galerina marginata CBS 339.88]|uniref:Uncharacterized protein n=1 Tax=Galerina marginata (strain CBS 339.88) TaxID=685588 RepID=A0A067TPR5_GALM3|nr:hypothetical protein GALMADRAFT_276551 [Galerina marginata CBS 339.88]